ncbi:MAG: hypothetical protein Q6366_006650 [Candidatus Freyarchaeota archaeon]
MSERFPKEIDASQLIAVLHYFVGNQEKMYGPVFNKLASKYIVEFESRKLGENPPGDIQSVDQARDYVVENLNRYPHGYCALLYGLIKAEAALQGGTGTSTRLATSKTAESIRLSSEGKIESASSIADAVKRAHEGIRTGKILPDFDYELVGEDQVQCTIYNCHLRDACETCIEEKLGRVGGRPWCALLRYVVADMGLTSGLQFDYELREFGDSVCKGKIYRV